MAARSFIHRASRRLGLRFFRFFQRPLQAEPARPPSSTLAPRMLGQHDVIALCGEADLDLREERVVAAYARGDFCIGAYDGGALAGYCWFAFAPLHHLDGVWVRFGEQVAWTYKSFVRPSHRGRGIAPQLYRFGDAACRERGRARSVICVESHNRPSIAAAWRAGYEAAGRAGYLRSRRRFLDWYSAPLRKHNVVFFVP